MQNLRIELVSPAWKKQKHRKRKKITNFFKVPPLGILNVATITPDDVEVEIIDEDYKGISYNENTDLAGISVFTATAPRAYEIAAEYKKRDIPVVMGGPHVSLMQEEGLQHADALVIGEAEGAWEKVIEDYRAGGREALKKTYQVEEKPDLKNIPFPNFDLLKQTGNYLFTNLFHVTRGCPHNCSFCSVTQLLGKKMRLRPVQDVIDEIKKRERKSMLDRLFIFMDDNIMANKQYAKELFRELIPLNIMWISQASINSAHDDELIELAGKSGCKGLFVGLESISEQSLKEVGKSQNTISFYEEAIQKFHKHGIFVEGAFIFGFDSDLKDVFENTVKFAEKVKLDGVQYTVLTPYPGTEFYEKIEREDRFINRDWSRYDTTHTVYKPINMSSDELQAGLHWAYKKTYSLPGILKRTSRAIFDGRIKFFFFLLAFNFGLRNNFKHMFDSAANPNHRNKGGKKPIPQPAVS
jgi:radical SAM superfamily enzyme YgiQ (UPF0313 family)